MEIMEECAYCGKEIDTRYGYDNKELDPLKDWICIHEKGLCDVFLHLGHFKSWSHDQLKEEQKYGDKINS